jgi:hypothetical protein
MPIRTQWPAVLSLRVGHFLSNTESRNGRLRIYAEREEILIWQFCYIAGREKMLCVIRWQEKEKTVGTDVLLFNVLNSQLPDGRNELKTIYTVRQRGREAGRQAGRQAGPALLPVKGEGGRSWNFLQNPEMNGNCDVTQQVQTWLSRELGSQLQLSHPASGLHPEPQSVAVGRAAQQTLNFVVGDSRATPRP